MNRSLCLINLWALALSVSASADGPSASPAGESKAIPFNQLGVEAQKQYSGDGIGITSTPDGAILRAQFQRLDCARLVAAFTAEAC